MSTIASTITPPARNAKVARRVLCNLAASLAVTAIFAFTAIDAGKAHPDPDLMTLAQR